MPDWTKVVRERLGNLRLPDETREEVIKELASHLEDCGDDTAHQRHSAGKFEVPVVRWSKLARAIRNAKREESLMNRRIKGLWLPALANLSALTAFMLLLDYFNTEEPGIATFGHFAKAFRPHWLLALPMLGALGAMLAKRARASFAERLVAGLAPALVWLAVIVTLGIFLVFDPQNFGGVSLTELAISSIGLVVLPTFALLLGIIPFVRKEASHQVEQ